MELSDILSQPEGFTPPSVTVRINKVHDYKAGVGQNGSWSFQELEVTGGRLKLKNLAEFPKTREGQTVTLRANQSQQHGLTGMKVAHEQYNGKTYDKLVITNSCKWDWGGNESAPLGNGSNQGRASAPAPSSAPQSADEYISHLLGVAGLTDRITKLLEITDETAIQACFATLCIDTKNRGIILPQNLPSATQQVNRPAEQGDPYEEAPPPAAEYDPAYDDDIPF